MKPDPDTHLPLALVCQEVRLRAARSSLPNNALEGLTHRRVSNAALDAAIPAERINGRWYVKKVDLPRIAELLGVMPKPRVGRPPRMHSAALSTSAAAAA
jgi:hypothetical protein